jgi:spermidine synthase
MTNGKADFSNAKTLILVAFFVSGACALVYEVIWTRMLGLVMGNTVYAVSTTLAAFMGGLALGSFILGRLADKMERPGRFYGIIEILIGLYCLVLPFLMAAADPLYSFVFRKFSASFTVLTCLRFVTAGTMLLVPAALMGATLPVLSRFYATSRKKLGWEIGRLYALNTWGAVLGTLLAGFVLLPALGVKASLVLAAVVNLSLGVAVIAASRAEAVRPVKSAASKKSADVDSETKRRGPFAVVALAFALSGMAALIYEVTWTRIISLLIGPSTYAFALMLSCFLIGLALGSFLAAKWIDRWKQDPVRVMAFLLLGGAVSALALVPALAGAVPYVREITRQHSQSFGLMYAAYFGLIALFLLLPTTILGAVFPVAVRAAAPAMSEVGRRVGGLYAANTVGAIAGSVLAGFVLVPVLGLSRAVAAGAIFHLAGSALLFMRSNNRSLAALCVAVVVIGFFLPPKVDQKKLNSGPYKYLYADNEEADRVLESRELLYYKEGVTATVSVTQTMGYLALTIDGKVDASLGADMDTQILLAHLPLLLSPNPENVLVVGLASGVTLGSAERHPEVKSIECVEISPEVIEACAFFEEFNYDPLSDPRLTLVVQDARNFMKMTDHSYDVIISEPSNPWMSGASALFTKEFFESCLSRLEDGGILCQWLQGYAIPTQMLQSVLATFCEVFPHVSLWMPLKGDLILLGSKTPFVLDPVEVTRRISSGKVREDLDRIRLNAWDELAGMNVGLGDDLCNATAGAPVQTDSRPLLEFALPKTLHRRIELAAGNLNWLAAPRGDPGVIVAGTEDQAAIARASAASYKEYLRGQVSEWTGDPGAAVGYYSRALSGAAGRRSALGPMYILMCRGGLDAERRNVPSEAIEVYRRATELAPERSEAHYLLGVLLGKSGRADEAATHLQAAVSTNPSRVEPAMSLADVLSELGRHEEARREIERATSMSPNDPRAWYGLARVQARAGDVTGARESLARAFSLAGPALTKRAASDTVLARAGVNVPAPGAARSDAGVRQTQ